MIKGFLLMWRDDVGCHVIKQQSIFYCWWKFWADTFCSVSSLIKPYNSTMLRTIINRIIIFRIHLCYTTVASIPRIYPYILPGIWYGWIKFFRRAIHCCIILCAAINHVVFLVNGNIIKFSNGNIIIMKPRQSFVVTNIKTTIISGSYMVRILWINP